MQKAAFLIIVLFCCHPAIGQFYRTDGDSTISAEVKALQSKNIDTVVCLYFDRYFMPEAREVKGLGLIYPNEDYYFFYRRGGRSYSEKLLLYSDTNTFNFVRSAEVLIGEDSLFVWLRKNIEYIQWEDIRPFIFQVGAGDSLYYETYEPFHQMVYYLRLYTPSDSSYKAININDLKSNVRDNNPNSYANLNYLYNIHTRLYRFFIWIKGYADKLEETYNFKKKE